MSSTRIPSTGAAGSPQSSPSPSSHEDDDGNARMSGLGARLAIAWTVVGVPLAYGVYETAKKASALFTG